MNCSCANEGYCPTLGRHMWGRNWELCQGVNCDLGESAVWRDFWRRDAEERGVLRPSVAALRRVRFRLTQAPGDALAFTAALYSLHKQFPGQFATSIETKHQEIFAFNPLVSSGGGTPLTVHYPAIHESSRRGITFLSALTEFLGDALEVPLRLQTNRPHLHFAAEQQNAGRGYWVVCNSVKPDFTTKRWHGWQELVDSLSGIEWVQVGAANDEHVPLRGATNFVGGTSLRQLFDLVREAEGVVCGVSLLMHVAAALEKPAVVIAGGREPVTWNSYPKQVYLHTALPCASCWIPKVEDCPHGVACMKEITPEAVRSAVETLRRQSAGTCSQLRCATAACSIERKR